MKKILFLFMLVLAAVLTAAAQDDTDTLSVDASVSMGAISPYVYGSNMNLYATIPMSLMEEAQALGLGFVRFGGGDTDLMDMRTNILDLFVLQMRAIGAEPLMSVRLLDGTPEAAAELVRYANLEKGYNIRYWSIGNEPNLFQSLLGAERYTTEELVVQWRAIAEAMLEVDPEIILVGPDITGYVPLTVAGETATHVQPSNGGNALDAEGRDWMVEFLRANGDLVDIVAVHRYPFGGNNRANPSRDQLRANLPEWDIMIANLRQLIVNITGREIPIAVTEFNSNSTNNIGGEATLDSHFNALWIGDVIGRLINGGVVIATQWDIQGGANRGWGLLGSYDVRPSAYTYMMYTHFGEELLSAASPDPNVTIYAARRADGALTLMVINLGETEIERTLDIAGFTPAGDAEVWRFDEATKAEQVEPQTITDGAVITLPPLSMTVYVIPAAN